MPHTAAFSHDRIPGRWAALAGLALLVSAAHAQGPIVLTNVTPQTGIAFQHTDGSGGNRYIVETVASGLATFDFDGDGLIDIYFLNGRSLRGTKPAGPPPKNRLYRNLGAWKFIDVTDQAGVGEAGFGLGVAIADYDNDGRPDIYASNYGPNVLFRNLGNGRFADVTAAARLDRGAKVGAGACFLDIDGDGRLDLFAANYVKFTYENHVARIVDGFPQYAGPKDYAPEPSNLFHNLDDGVFRDVSLESGIGRHAGTGMGVVCADCDRDGDTDIFVLNDVAANFLFVNDGQGHFHEGALAAGLAYNVHGHELGSMGADCADYDNDGWLDFFMTSYQGELPVLYRNLGKGVFEDVTTLAGAGAGALNNVKWGCGLVDFDNDGHKDIFIGMGHLQDNIEQWDDTTSYAARPVLLRNTGDGKFVNVSDSSGDGLQVKTVARGVAFDDLDNDGRIDVVILSSRRPAVVLRNESPGDNHWLQIQLRGVKTNRDGVGAQVQVTSGNLVQLDEVHSGRGYQSHFGSRLHFGLGKRDHIDRIEVHWLGGGIDVLQDIAVDRLLTITEGMTRQPTLAASD